MISVPLLETKDLTKVFQIGSFLKKGSLTAVDRVSFTLPSEDPQITALVGESGSGKTTIAKLILSFLKPTYGKILYKGKDIWELPKRGRENYWKKVQLIPQDPYASYNPFYKVDHLLKESVKNFGLFKSSSEADNIINSALETVGLRPDEVLGKYPHQLSGGQRQRILIARVLLLEPDVVVADEPVSMIDASIRAIILNTILRLKKEHKLSFLYITHDLSTAYYLSDDIIVLYLGVVVEKGDAETVIKNPVHPYTKLLIKSVPIPNPEVRWREKITLSVKEKARKTKTAIVCKFYDRCPYPMPICGKERPHFFDVEKDHQVACHHV